MWYRIRPYITTLFDEWSPPSLTLNQVVTLASPCVNWDSDSHTQSTVARWAAAALASPCSEGVGQSVVDAVLQIARNETLQPHIPIEIWAWLKRTPCLPPVCWGRCFGTTPDVVHHIRGLGDIEILKSYFLLVWSEWDIIFGSGLPEMEIIIREDFDGIGTWRHREELVERLDYVLGQLDRGLEYLEQHKPRIRERYIQSAKRQYGELKEVLLEVDKEAMETLSRTPPECSFYYNVHANADEYVQSPI